jgi:hypothetical protein
MPALQTTDGQSLVFCKAHYAIEDLAAVRQRLAAAGDFEPDDGGFVWLDREGNSVIRSDLTLGRIQVSADELVLETMSRERNTAGKRLLETLLGDLAVHRVDSIQDPESAIRDARARPRERAGDQVPEEIQREVIGNYLREHYRKWLDEPLPALGGKTPRKAARTKRGRAEVDAMLKDIENDALRMAGGDAIDVAGLRRELGLEIDRASATISYDAERAPSPGEWLAAGDTVRMQAIEAHHRSLDGHPPNPNARLHALMHLIVENQLAAGDPAEVRATLERLVAAGLTRHEAIHAIGSVMADVVAGVMRNNQAFDRVAATRSLARLRPESWRFTSEPVGQ